MTIASEKRLIQGDESGDLHRILELLREAYEECSEPIERAQFIDKLLKGIVVWEDLELVEARMIVSNMRNDEQTDDLSPDHVIKTSTLQHILNQLCAMSMKDGLTGLFNRRYLDHRLWQEVQGVTRERRPCALLIADVDFFKSVNDAYGHDVGDMALRHVAEKLVETCRRTDVVTRFGGEEFAVLMPGTGLRDAACSAERSRNAVESLSLKTPLGDIQLTVSIGVSACSPEHLLTVEQLIKAADTALYQAKAAGRNNVKTFGPTPPSATASAVTEAEKEELFR